MDWYGLAIGLVFFSTGIMNILAAINWKKSRAVLRDARAIQARTRMLLESVMERVASEHQK